MAQYRKLCSAGGGAFLRETLTEGYPNTNMLMFTDFEPQTYSVSPKKLRKGSRPEYVGRAGRSRIACVPVLGFLSPSAADPVYRSMKLARSPLRNFTACKSQCVPNNVELEFISATLKSIGAQPCLPAENPLPTCSIDELAQLQLTSVK